MQNRRSCLRCEANDHPQAQWLVIDVKNLVQVNEAMSAVEEMPCWEAGQYDEGTANRYFEPKNKANSTDTVTIGASKAGKEVQF